MEKETAIRMLDSQKFSTSIGELNHAVELVKQEHASNKELIRKLLLEEQRVRVLQISKVQESCSSCRWDMEAELRSLKQVVDARVKQRRDDDKTLLFQATAQATNCVGFETSLKKELHDWKQMQQNEKLEGNNFMQAVAAQMNNQAIWLETNFENMRRILDQHKMAYEAFEKQRTHTEGSEIDKSKNLIHPEEGSMRRALQETLWCLEKEVCDRMSNEEWLRQELGHVSLLVQPRQHIGRNSQPPRGQIANQFEAKLLEKVRSLSQNVLQTKNHCGGG